MTVVVPVLEKTGAAAIQAKITSLSAVPTTAAYYTYSQQLLNQTQIELVNVLLDQKKLNAASILTAVSYQAAKAPAAITAAITKYTALVTTYGATPPGYDAATKLDVYQRQLVSELIGNGGMSAAAVLSSQSYSGGAAN